MPFTTTNTTSNNDTGNGTTDSNLDSTNNLNTQFTDACGSGWWDAVENAGNNYAGIEQSQYIFEARAEMIDITGYQNDFTDTRRKTQNYDLIFHIPLTEDNMKKAFANFGMPQFQPTASEVATPNDMDSAAETNSEALRQHLLKCAQAWFINLNNAVTQPTDSLYDVSGQLSNDVHLANDNWVNFDSSGFSVKQKQNVMENWNEMLYEMGMVLTRYFGNKLTNSKKIITRSSVKKMLGEKDLMNLFPMSENQLILDAVRWRAAYWANKRQVPFVVGETKLMSIAFPFKYTFPLLASDGTTAINADRQEFTSKIEFHVVDGAGEYANPDNAVVAMDQAKKLTFGAPSSVANRDSLTDVASGATADAQWVPSGALNVNPGTADPVHQGFYGSQ